MAGKPIAEIIDAMLATPKEMGGIPVWQPFNYGGVEEARLLIPLLIGGESTGVDMVVTAYPHDGHRKFRMLIKAPKCVWRIDHVQGETHMNSLDRPADLREFSLTGPHYHAWADNRHFASQATLPDRLPNARLMPDRSFDSALRWFCSEVNIAAPPHGLIDLPQRRTLL
jgi:hypothetical protein